MHYHLEIIMPPTDDVPAAVAQIMKPFDENPPEVTSEDDEDRPNRHAFWDYWQIGGRWTGRKMMFQLGEAKIREFREFLGDNKVTISGLQWGKPTLMPATQIPYVDRLWREAFPDAPTKVCPLFDHYKDNVGDVLPLGKTLASLPCGHVIVAALDYQGKQLEAVFMVRDSIWNGVTHQDTTWDRTLGGALDAHVSRLSRMNPEYAAKVTPTDDWLVVTIDYHS